MTGVRNGSDTVQIRFASGQYEYFIGCVFFCLCVNVAQVAGVEILIELKSLGIAMKFFNCPSRGTKGSTKGPSDSSPTWPSRLPIVGLESASGFTQRVNNSLRVAFV